MAEALPAPAIEWEFDGPTATASIAWPPGPAKPRIRGEFVDTTAFGDRRTRLTYVPPCSTAELHQALDFGELRLFPRFTVRYRPFDHVIDG